MVFGAADPSQLVHMEDPHASSRGTSCPPVVGHALRREADADVSRPWRPSCARSSGSRASRDAGRAAPSTSPIGRGSRSPSMTTVAVPPPSVATTGRSAASDSIATTGVALVLGGQGEASKAAYPARIPCWKPTKSDRRRCGALARERLSRASLVAVPDEDEVRVDALVTSTRGSVRTRSSGRLIAREPAAQPTARRRPDPALGADALARSWSACALHGRQLERRTE